MGSVRRQDDMFMDGTAIFLFTLKVVPEMITTLLAKAKTSIEEVDLFVFHQASELIVQSSAKKLKIPREKLHFRLHDLGNSGGSTVGVTLTDAPDHFLISSFPLGQYLATDRALKVTVSSWQRIPDNAAPARGKIGGTYINPALAKTDAVEQGFDECIMLTIQGSVAEGSTENLFLVDQG